MIMNRVVCVYVCVRCRQATAVVEEMRDREREREQDAVSPGGNKGEKKILTERLLSPARPLHSLSLCYSLSNSSLYPHFHRVQTCSSTLQPSWHTKGTHFVHDVTEQKKKANVYLTNPTLVSLSPSPRHPRKHSNAYSSWIPQSANSPK